MAPTTNEALRDLLAPVVEGLGYELDALSVTPAGRRRVVRVTVDGDTPVDLDTVADISRALGSALDGANALGSTAYVLEVGSPGVERPLTEVRHWRRAIGRLVEVSPQPGAGGAFTGRLLTVADSGAVLDVGGTPRTVGWAAVDRARVQVEFRRPGGPDPDGAADPGDALDDDDIEDDDTEHDIGNDDDTEHDVGNDDDTDDVEADHEHDHRGGEATWTST